MEDLLYVAIAIAMMVIALLFVIGCDKIIGPDEQELVDESDASLAAEKHGETVAFS